MAYLITQSLIGAWNYMHTCCEERREKAYKEFLDTLNRVQRKTTKEMQNGIDFENEVYKQSAGIARSAHPKWENGIRAVATVLTGAPVQIKARRGLTLGSTELLVYGVLDALKAGTIYDVKFSNKSFASAELAGKYLNSPQHPTYFFLVPEATRFQYLVSDGEDLYTETYTRANSVPFEELAKEFLEALEALGLMGVYKEKWVAT